MKPLSKRGGEAPSSASDAGLAPAGDSSSRSESGICICDPELFAMEICDLRCPTHGLAATLTEALRARKREEEA